MSWPIRCRARKQKLNLTCSIPHIYGLFEIIASHSLCFKHKISNFNWHVSGIVSPRLEATVSQYTCWNVHIYTDNIPQVTRAMVVLFIKSYICAVRGDEMKDCEIVSLVCPQMANMDLAVKGSGKDYRGTQVLRNSGRKSKLKWSVIVS